MAKAAKVVIAEVESIVPVGSFGFDHAHLNSIYVDYLYIGNNYKKSIERLVYDESVYKKNPGNYIFFIVEKYKK
jgi:3-oxoacid CoA-transferase